MHTFRLVLFCFPFLFGSVSAQIQGHWETRSPMPVARTNIAAASLELGDTTWIYTFLGLDSTKACGNTPLDAWKYNTVSDVWSPIAAVPGPNGRIAASATGFQGKVYLMGGYEVATNCNEFTSPRVDIYDPVTDSWSLGSPPPTKIDDHVQVLWRDSLIVTVSGWSQNTNTRRVQMYDAIRDTWLISTPIAGPGLFGHCGGIVGDTIIYLDGVRISGFNFVLTNNVWQGIINPVDPTQVTWTNLGQHPGPAVYRGGGFEYAGRVLFTGGTDNAYNIDGIGYNSVPSVETGKTFGYDVANGIWETYASNPDSVMDVREIVPVNGNQFYSIGGMEANQTVSRKVSVFVVDTVITAQYSPAPAWEVAVYPTYITDRMHIHIPDWEGGRAHARLLDLNGKPVFNQPILSAKSEISLPAALTTGLYFLEIRMGDQKFIKKVVLE